MKNEPCSGWVEYWAELTMLAPWSTRKLPIAATIPGPSGHEISSRAVCVAPCPAPDEAWVEDIAAQHTRVHQFVQYAVATSPVEAERELLGRRRHRLFGIRGRTTAPRPPPMTGDLRGG